MSKAKKNPQPSALQSTRVIHVQKTWAKRRKISNHTRCKAPVSSASKKTEQSEEKSVTIRVAKHPCHPRPKKLSKAKKNPQPSALQSTRVIRVQKTRARQREIRFQNLSKAKKNPQSSALQSISKMRVQKTWAKRRKTRNHPHYKASVKCASKKPKQSEEKSTSKIT